MLTEGRPEYLIAFHDDIEASKGTKDMIAKARRANIPGKLVTTTGVKSW